MTQQIPTLKQRQAGRILQQIVEELKSINKELVDAYWDFVDYKKTAAHCKRIGRKCVKRGLFYCDLLQATEKYLSNSTMSGYWRKTITSNAERLA